MCFEVISCPILYSSACALEVVPPDESKSCDLGEMLPPGVISNCFTLSPRRPYGEYKRMVLEHTHGLFIT
jgi:hypothetical protein